MLIVLLYISLHKNEKVGFVSVTGQNVTCFRDGGVVQERANGPLPAVHSARGSLSFRFRTRGNGYGPVS